MSKFDDLGIVPFEHTGLVGSKRRYPTKEVFVEGCRARDREFEYPNEDWYGLTYYEPDKRSVDRVKDISVRGCLCAFVAPYGPAGFHYEVAYPWRRYRGIIAGWLYG